MLILRILGVLLILLAFAALVGDGAGTLASPGDMAATSLREHWAQLNPTSLEKAQAFVQGLGVPGLWDSLLARILALPAWASLGAMGMLVYWLGRRRRNRYVLPD
jgi:hypothetical protein